MRLESRCSPPAADGLERKKPQKGLRAELRQQNGGYLAMLVVGLLRFETSWTIVNFSLCLADRTPRQYPVLLTGVW